MAEIAEKVLMGIYVIMALGIIILPAMVITNKKVRQRMQRNLRPLAWNERRH